jgi:hypothetical protein
VRLEIGRAAWGWTLACVLGATPAAAQQVLQFKPVGGDSVSSITVGPGVVKMTTKSGRTVTVVEPPDSAPRVPGAPEPPEPPDVQISRMHDIVRFGSSIHVSADERVAGNVVSMGGDITVEGQVQGDVVCIGGRVELGPQARVEGDLVALGGDIERAAGSVVGGEIVTAPRVPGGMWLLPVFGLVGRAVAAVSALFSMLILMAIAWAAFSWLPEHSGFAVESLRSRPAHALGIGLLSWVLLAPSVIALAVITVILCITIIGIPVAVLVIVAYAFGLVALGLWGYAVGCAAVGVRVIRGLRSREPRGMTEAAVWGVGLMGVLAAAAKLLSGFGLIGILGGVLNVLVSAGVFLILTMGGGALLLSLWSGGAMRRWWSQVRGGRGTAQPVPAVPDLAPDSAPSGSPPGSVST